MNSNEINDSHTWYRLKWLSPHTLFSCFIQLVKQLAFLLNLWGQCFCQRHFMTSIKLILNRPNKYDYKYETHQEANVLVTGHCLPPLDDDREAWTQVIRQQLHCHLVQLPKDEPKAQLYREHLHGPSTQGLPGHHGTSDHCRPSDTPTFHLEPNQ